MSRRAFLATLAGTGVAGGTAYLVARGIAFSPGDEQGRAGVPAPVADSRLEAFAENIQSGGPPKDGIPSIDEPRFVSSSEATFLSDQHVVFGLRREGQVRAYPQIVLAWHEIVNDRFPDGPLTVTYCPLTGSTVAFRGEAPGGEPYTFGTSGDLVNSNLLMYDRQTDSRWPQILGQSILGPARGRRLEEVPVHWTTWGRWRALHPDTEVLSTETGFIRDYSREPYGSYTPLSGYYAPGSGRFFRVMHEDPRFDDKEVFVGVKHRDARLAARKEVLRSRKVVSSTMGRDPVALLYDPALDEGRAYLELVDGREVELSATGEAGRYIDATESIWDQGGRAVEGPLAGAELPRMLSYDVMWFAWAAFFPETEVIG